MAEETTITSDGFASLLNWLDPDIEQAGRRYEFVRARLIYMFVCRGCHEPELLTDRTFDRVTRKVLDQDGDIDSDRINFVYGVARFIYKEWLREQKKRGIEVPVFDLTVDPAADLDREAHVEIESGCLETCLAELTADDRYMIVEYYREQGPARAEHRRSIAKTLKISNGTLRMRVDRLLDRLKKCVRACSEKNIENSL